MDEEEIFDMHMCLVCQSTVVGLVNYINHKKYHCPGKRQNTSEKNPASTSEKGDNPISATTSTDLRKYEGESRVKRSKSVDLDLGTVISVPDDGSFNSSCLDSLPVSSRPQQNNIFNSDQSPVSLVLPKNKPSEKSNILTSAIDRSLPATSTSPPALDGRRILSLPSTVINNMSQQNISVDVQDNFSNFKSDAFSPGSGNAVDPNMVMTASTRSSGRPEDFFSSLALQSKSQHQGHGNDNDNSLTSDLPISNILNNLNFSSDDEDIDFSFSEDDLFDEAFSDDTESDDDLRPPRNHTKGKWKPGQGPTPPQTGGKWKPGQGPLHPSVGKWRPGQRPVHSTGGKWKPGQSLLSNTGKKKGRSTIPSVTKNNDKEYFCIACNLYFRNRFSFSSHCTGKQHKENVIIGKCYDNEVDTLDPIDMDNLDAPQLNKISDFNATSETSGISPENIGKESQMVSVSTEKENTNDQLTNDHSFADLQLANQTDSQKPQDWTNNHENSQPSEIDNEKSNGEPGNDIKQFCVKVLEEMVPSHDKSYNDNLSIDKEMIEKITTATVAAVCKSEVTTNSQENSTQVLLCVVCDKKFYSKYVLARHILSSYHKNRAKGHSSAIKVLQEYNKYIVKLSPYQCTICHYYFNRQEDLKSHLQCDQHLAQVKNVTGQLICTLCKFTSFNNDDIVSHLVAHAKIPHSKTNKKPCIIKERHYKADCKYCGKSMHSRMHMKRHINHKHAAELHQDDTETQSHSKYRCLICMEVFWNYNEFNRHMAQNHKTKDEYYCQICDKHLADNTAYKRHLKGFKHKEKLAEENKELSEKKFEVVDDVLDLDYVPTTKKKKSMKLVLRAVSNERRKRKRIRNKPENKIYKCDHCEHSVTKYSDLRPHYMEVHSNQILVCELCDVSFISEKALKHHNQSRMHQNNLCEAEESQTQQVFSCEICKRRFSDEGWKQFHVEVYHLHPNSEDALQAKLGRVDITAQQYQSELQKLAELDRDEKVSCPECGKLLKKEHLLEHLRLHTGDKPFSCRHCTFSFVSALSLRRHLLSHMGLTERKCEECGKEYKKISSYKEHMLQHQMQRDGKQKFMCDICGQAFYLQKQLNNHMRRHGERKFKCPFDNCPWRFYFSNELESHIRSHTREKPFLCDICGYAAATKNRLLRHSRTHTGERKFHCEYCTYKAGTSTHLRRHMRIHIGSKPYKCPYCDYSCNTHENIRKHIVKTKKHAGLCIYPCKFCSYGTNKVADFREHLAANHPQDFDGKLGGEGLAEMTGLYKKEQDPRKPSEGMRIVPAKERRERVNKKNLVTGNKKKAVTNGVKHEEKGRSEFGVHPHSHGGLPSDHINWQVEMEKEARDAAAILASASSASALHHLHHQSGFHSSLGLMMSSGSYGYYPEPAHSGSRTKTDAPYIPNGSTDGVIRIEPQHSSVNSEGERGELIIDYLEMDVENS